MLQYIWPVGLVVLSNVFYHICAKSVPESINPFASMVFTYAIGCAISLILFFIFGKGCTIGGELAKINWAAVVLGIVIVGLEVGSIFVYRAGWQIGVASVVENIVLAVLLIFVGRLLYKEPISVNKLIGLFVCLCGLYIINRK